MWMTRKLQMKSYPPQDEHVLFGVCGDELKAVHKPFRLGQLGTRAALLLPPAFYSEGEWIEIVQKIR